jgi:PAS domain S-box-containing protein
VSEKEIVNSLGSSDERFRVLYENSPLGIELYDAEGVLIDVNRACLDIFGIDDVSVVRRFRLFDDPNLSEQHKRLHDGKR